MAVNKAVASVLVAGIAFMVSTLVADGLVSPTHLTKTAIEIELPKPAPTAAQPGAPQEQPVGNLIAAADPKAGDALAHKVCGICHSFNEGGKAIVGPNLYGVVGAPHGHMEGFAYSDALKAKQGPWTYDELNAWLTDPRTYAPGTKMGFAGLPSEQQRAEIIAYLRTLAHDPVPLPKPVPVQKAAAEAPAPATGGGGGESFDKLVAASDAADGGQLAKKYCGICHSFEKGGRAAVGPNLFGVVGAPHAHMEGYAYSDALKAKQGPWTLDELNQWLTDPRAYAPGTKMAFAGLPSEKQRAEIVAYLRSDSDNPPAK
jgi:cytochrome c